VRSYPSPRKGSDVDDYHGEQVADPYRWLETTTDPETVAWIGAQNELTESFLEAVPGRDAIRARVTELSDYPKLGVPFERGGRWFQFRNPGLAAQPVLYVMDEPGADGRPLLDPNTLSADGTTAVSSADVSDDGKLLAYATSDGGSDWLMWRVRDVETGTDREDVIEWSKFCRAAWRADGSGFYYSSVPPTAPGAEYLEANVAPKIMLHRIGTAQADDELAFAAPDEPGWFPYAEVSDDGRFLILTIEKASVFENQVLVRDLNDSGGDLRPLVGDFESVNTVVSNDGTTFYLVTDHAAGRKRLVAVDLDQPGRPYWRDVVPEAAETLVGAWFFGGYFVCHYLRDAQSVLRVHARDGRVVREIPVPGMAALALDPGIRWAITGRASSDVMHFSVTTFTDPGSIWSHQLPTGRTELASRAAVPLDQDSYLTEQVFAESPDGTRVPVFLTRRRDLQPDGQAPALLYAYGGFDIAITPAYSPEWAAWLDRGGVLAVANLRGGGEYGRAWHEAGRRGMKQNVFDDFCACARFLAASGWSSADRVAITGASNGGLLVGACLTQHPELFAACVPHVGVHDMLRFHKFTIGWAWTGEFGSADEREEYQWLRRYSPLHNVRPGQRYPATLVLTGDHDDRVVPGHSFKFAAALQAAQAGDEPILIRVETAAGHGAGKPTDKQIAADADVLAFLAAVLPDGARADAPKPQAAAPST
jgi:prolyl oligopeptidase